MTLLGREPRARTEPGAWVFLGRLTQRLLPAGGLCWSFRSDFHGWPSYSVSFQTGLEVDQDSALSPTGLLVTAHSLNIPPRVPASDAGPVLAF